MILKYSQSGVRHIKNKEENQDALYSASNQRYTVISLADGVSNCKKAKTGAEIACRAITNLFFKKASYFLHSSEEETARISGAHVLFELKQQATIDSSDVTEYSSTLTSILLDRKKQKLLYSSLGDSLIIAIISGQCHILAMPSESTNGCIVTTTNNNLREIQIGKIDSDRIDAVIILSDGAWKKLYDKNMMKTEVRSLLGKSDFRRLMSFLSEQNCLDDYSFIAIDLCSKKRRSTA